MDNGTHITLTRNGEQTYSWQPQKKAPKLLLTVLGLALLVAVASFAIGAIMIATLAAIVLVAAAMIRRSVRRWLGGGRNSTHSY